MKPWLLLPPSISYKLGPLFLKAYGRLKPYQTLTWLPKTWRGLEFTNPMGIAGGVDKDLETFKAWWTLGVGFVEVGTITPKPQAGHSGQVIDRNSQQMAVWNKLGFPSKGVQHAVQQLKDLYKPHFTPIFANIGKNKTTSNDKAHEDYIQCMKQLSEHVDAFVLNVSSPNTEDLRELLKPKNLKSFLKPIIEANSSKIPIILKISPDISNEELKHILDVSLELKIDGWILTNTTSDRKDSPFPKEGGVSGQPLHERSKSLLKEAIKILGANKGDRLLISTGGIMTPEDAFERLRLGADLVQVYSSLIFEGPYFFRNVADKASLTF